MPRSKETFGAHRDEIDVSVTDGVVQRSPSVFVGGIDIRFTLDKSLESSNRSKASEKKSVFTLVMLMCP